MAATLLNILVCFTICACQQTSSKAEIVSDAVGSEVWLCTLTFQVSVVIQGHSTQSLFYLCRGTYNGNHNGNGNIGGLNGVGNGNGNSANNNGRSLPETLPLSAHASRSQYLMPV